eukprot:tig00020927_g15959.t1
MDVRSLYSPEQIQILEQFRSRLGDLTPEQKRFCDDACLFRYLRAREWKIPKSETLLRETLQWRAENRPELLRWQDVEEGARTGKLFRWGYDKEGHPIIVLRPRFENLKDSSRESELKVKLLTYTVERAIASMPPGVEKMVLMIDFKGYSSSNAPDMKTTKASIAVLSNYYPERLARAVACDPPWYFNTFWSLVKPFVDPVTRQKLVFKKSDKPWDSVWQVIPRDQLQSWAQGSAAFEYDHSSYSAQMAEEDIWYRERQGIAG